MTVSIHPAGPDLFDRVVVLMDQALDNEALAEAPVQRIKNTAAKPPPPSTIEPNLFRRGRRNRTSVQQAHLR